MIRCVDQAPTSMPEAVSAASSGVSVDGVCGLGAGRLES